MKNEIQERLLELLADRAIIGLNSDEAAELETLEKNHPELAGDDSFELAAAGYQLASVEDIEPVSDSLMNRLSADAESYFAESAEEEEAPSTIRNVEFESPKASFTQWLGWLVAGAACVALIANIWMIGIGPAKEVAVDSPPPPPLPTATQKRETLLATSGTVKTDWSSPQTELKVEGDVVWSDQKQEGYMTFRGLPANDKSKETYQLWIFDKTQDDKTPIDGGVFDVSSDGTAVVPIDAKLKVNSPQMFAVTVEKPGGVVVSKREKIVALAKV